MTSNTVSPPQPAAAKVRSAAVTASLITMIGLNGLEVILFAVALALMIIRKGQVAGVTADSAETASGAAVVNALTLIGSLMTGCGVLQFILYIACAILFLVWISKSFHTMQAVRSGLISTSPGYAVGGFFIPFLNLVHGFNMLKELWQASNPVAIESEYFIPTRVPSLMRWWWGMFLADNIMGRIISLSKSETIDDAIGVLVACIVGAAISIVAAILAIKVVQATTGRTNECLELPYSPTRTAPVVAAANSATTDNAV